MRDTTSLKSGIAALRTKYEADLATMVEVATVSMDPGRRADMKRGAEVGCGLLREAGAEVTLAENGGHPIVVGRIVQDPSFPTITIYNHLDVQPADPAEWKTPPFTFTRTGDRYFGRGTTDDKGPALAALHGARLALQDGVRANIAFLWELEEEIGSPNFETGLKSAVAGGFRTDVVVVSDTIWIAAGKPALPYGLRGLVGFTVRLQTGAKDVHSGTTGGAARNPVGELAALITELYDARTGRVKIPGFYDDVCKLGATERAGLRRSGFTRQGFQSAHELSSLRFSDDQSVMEAVMARPTFEVHGLVGGYTGPGIKTIVPHAAEAKLSCRLVPDQTTGKTFKLIKSFIKKHCPDAVVTPEGALAPYRADIGGPYHQAAVAAMKETFGREPGLTREGGSIGAVLTMRRHLAAPVLFMGLSLPEHGYHAINENFDWGQASGGMEMFYRYFHAVAAVAPRQTRARIRA